MAGLLQQLQRNKGRSPAKDSREAVVRSSVRDDSGGARDVLSDEELLKQAGFEPESGRRFDAEAVLLSSDLGAFAPGDRQSRGGGVRGDSQRSSVQVGSDDAPWWFVEEIKRNPQVDQLVDRVLPLVHPMSTAEEGELRATLRALVAQGAATIKDEIRVTRKLLEQAENEVLKLLDGYGPLDALLEDSLVSDIFVDGYRSIRVIRGGHAAETPFSFRSAEEYGIFTNALLRRLHQPLTADHPIAEGVLPDRWRTRCSVVHQSVVEGGEVRVALHVPRLLSASFFDVLQQKVLPATVAAWLAELVATRDANILVVGVHRQGRAMLASALASAVGSDERMVLVEPVPMFSVSSVHVERLVPHSASSAASVSALLELARRRSPHRVVVGDLVGAEALELLRLLEYGCRGSIATVPAATPSDGMWHLVDSSLEERTLDPESLIRRFSRSIHLIISVRQVDGTPCLDEIAEVGEPISGRFVVRPLVRFHGVNNGKRQWQLQAKQSYWMTKLRERGSVLVPGPSLLAPTFPDARETVELRAEQILE